MLNRTIKYPIAYNKVTKKLIEIKDVNDEDRKSLICKECNEGFVAVLDHQTPHFKHKPNSSCKGANESYIHWVTKELFKELEEIELPDFEIDELPEKEREKFQLMKNSVIDKNVPETYRIKFKNDLRSELIENRVYKIDDLKIEKHYNTSLGGVKVDIEVISGGEKLFIEPYFSNMINEDKEAKFSELKVKTIAIDLVSFIEHYKVNFSLQDLKNYLINKISKTWSYLSYEDYDNFIDEYKAYLFEKIKEHKSKIDNIYKNQISDLNTEIERKLKYIKALKAEIEDSKTKVNDLKKRISIDKI